MKRFVGNWLAVLVAVFTTAAPAAFAGDVKVSFEPAEVLSGNPLWALFLNGQQFTAAAVHDEIQTNIPSGEYTLGFSSVDGWINPVGQTVVVGTTGLQELTATYRKGGTVTVNFEPNDVLAEAPLWALFQNGQQVTAAAGHNDSVLALPGTYVVGYGLVGGWVPPATQTIVVVEEGTQTVSATYDRLEVSLNPGSLDSGAEQPALFGAVNDNSVTVTVTIEGKDYPTRLLADGSWYLERSEVDALPDGDYAVLVTAEQSHDPGNGATITGTVRVRTLPFTEFPTDELAFTYFPDLVVGGLADSFRDFAFDRYALITGSGTMQLRTDRRTTPLTAYNFARYQEAGLYERVIIHRAAGFGDGSVGVNGQFSGPADFVLQAGNARVVTNEQTQEDDWRLVETFGNLINEPGVPNTRGTISMAKLGGDPDSATSQWFLSLGDNRSVLDNQNGGFTVFGELEDAGSLAVMDALATIPRWNKTDEDSSFSPLPLTSYTAGDDVVDHFVTVTVEPLPPALTFEVTSSDAAVVTGAILNGDLVLSRGSQAGSATITVTATADDGRVGSWQAEVTNFSAAIYGGIVSEGQALVSGMTVYFDLDEDGQLDDGEPQATTDETGRWEIETAAESYVVRLDLPSGATASPISRAVDETGTTADFEVAGVVFVTYSGVVTEGAHSVNGVTVYLDANDNGQLDGDEAQATSGVDGSWEIIAAPRSHIVRLDVADGVGVSPTSVQVDFFGRTGDFSVTGVLTIVFSGVVSDGQSGTPGVTVYFDENGNGQLDDDEISTVTAADNVSTTVDEAGNWQIREKIETHQVRLDLPDGVFATPVVAILDGDSPTQDFVISNTRTAQVEGFIDGNDNGTFDDGETVVAELPIEARLNGTLVATASAGEIPGLLPVDYDYSLGFDAALALGYVAGAVTAVEVDGQLVLRVPLQHATEQAFDLELVRGWNLVSLPGVPKDYAPLNGLRFYTIGRRIRRVSMLLSLRAYWVRSDTVATIPLELYLDPRPELSVTAGLVDYGVAAPVTLTLTPPTFVWDGRGLRRTQQVKPGQGVLTARETAGQLPVR